MSFSAFDTTGKSSSRTITTRDVAALAGVNRASVSVVLNGAKSSTGVSEEMRQRILAAADQLGYRRNSMAASVRSGRFNSVALLSSLENRKSGLFKQLFNGLHDALFQRNLHLLVTRLPDETLTSEEFMPKVLKEWLVDGLIVNYNVEVPTKLFELLEKTHTPAIWVNVKREHDCVFPDDWEAGYQATRHLLDLGHRDILFASSTTSHFSIQDRCDGFLAAMAEARCEPRIHVENNRVRGWNAFTETLTREGSWPTAIVAYNVYAAHPILVGAKLAGLRVPEDLSIVNFDEATVGDFAYGKEITTVLLPEYEMGQAAVEMICQKIEGADALPPRRLPCKGIQGETTAPPRQ